LEEVRSVLGVTSVGTDDLAFNLDEASELAAGVLGRTVSETDVRALLDGTDGWASALVLAARSLKGGAPGRPHAAASTGHPFSHSPGQNVIAALLDTRLQALAAPERDALCQLAHLPYFSPEIAAVIGAPPDMFQRVVLAGVPVLRTAAGRWEMAGPVATYLSNLKPLSAEVAAAVAATYGRQGQVLPALRMLVGAGFHLQAASLLAGLAPAQAEELGWAEISSIVESLPGPVVARYPGVLLHLARTADTAFRSDVRRRALERASSVLNGGEHATAALTRELQAELARDLLNDDRERHEARRLASSVVEEASSDEGVARARALGTLGRLRSWWSDDGPHEDAKDLLEEEARIAQRLGQPAWAARALVSLAVGVYFGLCHYQRALATLDQTLALVPARNPYRSYVLNFRLTVLCALGRYEECETIVSEMRHIGLLTGEDWLQAFTSWSEAELASFSGDPPRVVGAVSNVIQHRGTWFDGSPGIEFLAQGADLLDRVGEHTMATHYMEQAKARMTGFERVVWVYESAILGRSGDPERAEAVIASTLARSDLDPQERWPLMLLRAYAAHRRQDGAAGRLAAEALETCRELGIPDAPLVRERVATETLLPLAVAAGSATAASLVAGAAKVSLTLLGGLELRRGGQVLVPPPGRPAEAICVIATAGRAVHSEELMETLWPGVAPATGRNRLKNLLSRLRAAVGDVLVRDEEMVILGPGATSDAAMFEAEGRRALKARSLGDLLQAAGLARSAVDRYRGDLLPAYRYKAWAAEPRERLRLLYLELLDLLALRAQATGDVDEATRLVQRAIDAEPYDEERYVLLAGLLTSQGRVGSARAVLRRARAMLEEIGLPASDGLRAAEISAGEPPSAHRP
jgi:DNA-binding SARP family transcriptional activator/ATP/maltotriose-dependent transcriptional regulator MalT